MSQIILTIITVGVLLSVAFIIRWQRHFFMRRMCPGELFFLESIDERNRVGDLGYTAFLKLWRTWITLLIYSAALALPSYALSEWLGTAAQRGQVSLAGARFAVLLPVIGQMFLIPLMCARYRKWMRAYLRRYLNDHGIPICQNCGYDLRGLVSRVCPECASPARDRRVCDLAETGRD